MFITKSGAALFGLPELADKGFPVLPEEYRSPFVPAANPVYNFRIEHLRVVLSFIFNPSRLKKGMYLFGPSGTGKTSIIMEVCARLVMEVHYVCASEELQWSDLIGSFQFTEPGKMDFVYGPLATAYRDGGIFVFDEMDQNDLPAGLFGVLEGRPLKLPNGEVVQCHSDFRFFGTGNTNGAGDWSGKYNGTRKQNEALMQRLKPLEVSYPDAAVEAKIVSDFLAVLEPDLPVQIREAFSTNMVKVATQIRAAQMDEQNFSGDAIEIDFSTRTLLSWSEEYSNFRATPGVEPIHYSLERAVLARASRPTREAVLQMVTDVFGTF